MAPLLMAAAVELSISRRTSDQALILSPMRRAASAHVQAARTEIDKRKRHLALGRYELAEAAGHGARQQRCWLAFFRDSGAPVRERQTGCVRQKKFVTVA
jgi:hypothetical protein